ncbi:MAG: hypothetical protein K8W52_09615 [Deltaproteobacteria bacterium]|nr:hypothetical protein [Deltaproteobacteria bacterium]
MSRDLAFGWLGALLACGASGACGSSGDPAASAARAAPAKRVVSSPVFRAIAPADAPFALGDLAIAARTNLIAGQALVPADSQYLRVEFTLTRTRPSPGFSELAFKSTCLVGDEYLAAWTHSLLRIADLEVDHAAHGEALLYAADGFEGAPRACELRVYLTSLASDDPPAHFADYCWSGGAITAGTCPGFARPPGDGVVYTLTKVRGQVAGHVDLAATMRLGTADDGTQRLAFRAACTVDGVVVVDESTPLARFDFAEPGEAVRFSDSAFLHAGLPGAPSQCQLAITSAPVIGGKATTLGTYCLKGAALSDGACP